MLMYIFRFWSKRVPRHRGGYDQKQSTKDLCGHTLLDGARGYGASEYICAYKTQQLFSLRCSIEAVFA